jgi:hypothetical protein
VAKLLPVLLLFRYLSDFKSFICLGFLIFSFLIISTASKPESLFILITANKLFHLLILFSGAVRKNGPDINSTAKESFLSREQPINTYSYFMCAWLWFVNAGSATPFWASWIRRRDLTVFSLVTCCTLTY